MIKKIIKLIAGTLYKPKTTNGSQKETQVPSKKLYKKYYNYESIEDIPDNVKPNIIYHVGENNFKWLVVLKCPCGCGDTLQLNLLNDSSPCWRVKFHFDGDVSIYPSVNRIINCRSHFNITKNSVRWWEVWVR